MTTTENTAPAEPMTVDKALSTLGNPESSAAQESEAVGFLIKTGLSLFERAVLALEDRNARDPSLIREPVKVPG